MTDIENVLREMRDFANGDWAKERGIGKDLNQWAEAIEATMREKDAEIENLKALWYADADPEETAYAEDYYSRVDERDHAAIARAAVAGKEDV